MSSEIWTSERLAAMIERKYPSDARGYNPNVILREVANGTGGYTHRWVDVVVLSMWGSLTRAAFEIKVSRQDFLRELAQPEKHQWVQDSFHEFWFVAPKDIIQVEELPVGAGFMYPRGDKLCIGRNAVRNRSPKLDDILLAAFMRSAWKSIQSARATGEKEALTGSVEHRSAKMYKEAAVAFLNSHKVSLYSEPKDSEQIVSWLRESTMDLELKKERDHLLALLETFQHHLLEAASGFLVAAGTALLEKDELGRYLNSAWGGNDKAAMAALDNMKKRAESEKDRDELAEKVREVAKEENNA